MEVRYSENALLDIAFWKSSGNIQVQKKITALIESITETPYTGIGKPEALKGNLNGYWSRRITQEHRIIYTAHIDYIKIHSLRGHYLKY